MESTFFFTVDARLQGCAAHLEGVPVSSTDAIQARTFLLRVLREQGYTEIEVARTTPVQRAD